MSTRGYRVARGTIWIVALAAFCFLLYEGRSYYLTPLIERPRHDSYWQLKPGGSYGYWFGVAGALLMLVMHLYSVRRRARAWRRLGTLSAWLDFHIFCGLMGPLLIVLHSSFKVRGLVALSFWSMVAVSLSGVLGRYLYVQIPRRRTGDQLSLTEARELDRHVASRLRSEFGLLQSDLERLDGIAMRSPHQDAGPAGLLLWFPFQGVTLRWRLSRFARGLGMPSGRSLRTFLRVARQKALLERRIRVWQQLQQLFHYWHVFHRPFAVVMYLFLLVHLLVVMVTGYGWLPGR